MRNVRGSFAVVAAALLLCGLLGAAAPALGAVSSSKDPLALSHALADHPAFVVGAGFDALPPAGLSAAVSTDQLAGFWTSTETPDFAILSTGDAAKIVPATDPAQFARASDDLGGTSLRGGQEHDVTILRIELQAPHGANCLSFDYRFLSEEFSPGEPTSAPFDDAFIAELDASTWTAFGGKIEAPLSFARTPADTPVTARNAALFMTAEGALGTAFDRATPIWQAVADVRSGERHTLYLTVLDGIDSERDSAVLIDRLAFGTREDGACALGPTLVTQIFADEPRTVIGGANGYRILVEAVGGPLPQPGEPLSSPIELASVSSVVAQLPPGFSYIPRSTSGSSEGDPSIGFDGTHVWRGPFGAAPAPNEDAIELRFGVFAPKDPGAYIATATVETDGGYLLLPPAPGAPIEVAVPSADLKLGFEQSPAVAKLDEPLELRFLVANGGPQPASGAKLELSLPASLANLTIGTTHGSCAASDALVRQAVSCQLGTIVSGDTATVTARGVLRGSDLALGGNVSAVEADHDLANNTLADSARVVAADETTPIVGETVATKTEKGKVKVKPPNEKAFVKLESVKAIPVGTTIDARKGEVTITAAVDADGEIQAATFGRGKFVVRQQENGLTTLKLTGGDFSKCSTPKKLKNAERSTQKFIKDSARRARRVIRRLWGRGKGKFRTRGRYAAATVRGTVWRTVDRCDGTLIRVKKGVVVVRDVNRKRAVKVKGGQQYLVKRVRAAKKPAKSG